MRESRWQTTRRATLVAVACWLVLCSLLAAGVVASEPATQEVSGQRDGSLPAQDIDADAIAMSATLDASGDAEWAVVYRLQLDSDEKRQAFEELRAEVRDNESAYLDPFEERIRRTAENARSTTGREMSVDGFAVAAERTSQPDAEFGEVTFRFTWRGFAAVEDGGELLRAGDALDRLVLDEDASLELRWPAEYSLVTHAPSAPTVEDDRVAWRGPLDFETGEPRVELATDGGTDDGTTDGGTDDGTDGTDGDGAGGLSPLLWFVAAVVVVGVAGGALVAFRPDLFPVGGADADDDGTGRADASEGVPDDGGAGGGGASGGGAGDTAVGPPPELLSNEERVLQLLEQRGGRMKQKAVAEELDWTAAKTSQVVSDLRDDGDVEAFRLGRENVLTLPEVDLRDDTGDAGDGSGRE